MANDMNPSFMAQVLMDMGRINYQLDTDLQYSNLKHEEAVKKAEYNHSKLKEAEEKIVRLYATLHDADVRTRRREKRIAEAISLLHSAHDNLARKDLRKRIKQFIDEVDDNCKVVPGYDASAIPDDQKPKQKP